MIIVKLFIWAMAALSAISALVEIFKEIKEKTFFKTKRAEFGDESFLWKSVFSSRGYSLIDLFFDICYFFLNLRSKGCLFLTHILLTLVSVTLLWWVPALFAICLVWNLIKNIGILAKVIWKKESKTIKLWNNTELREYANFKGLIDLWAKLPGFWAWILIYYVVAAKKKKINWKNFDTYLISKAMQMPFWLLKLGVKIADIVYKSFTNYSLRRKKWWVKPRVIWRRIREGLHVMTLNQYKEVRWLLLNNKIIILNNEILLNPLKLEEALLSMRVVGLTNFFHIPIKVMVGGCLHQAIIRRDGVAFIMTKQGKTRFNEHELPSKSLSLEYLSQRFHISKLDLTQIEYEEGFIENFFINKEIFNYEKFAGLVFRLNLLFRTERSNVALAQGEKTSVKKSIKEEKYLWEIYGEGAPEIEGKNWSTSYGGWEKNNKTANQGIADWLYEQSNEDLYNVLKNNYKTDIDSLEQLIKKEHQVVMKNDEF